MPNKELVTIISEDSKEKIFIKVSTQERIPRDKVKFLTFKPLIFKSKPFTEIPSLIVLNIPKKINPNSVYIIETNFFSQYNWCKGYYCKIRK